MYYTGTHWINTVQKAGKRQSFIIGMCSLKLKWDSSSPLHIRSGYLWGSPSPGNHLPVRTGKLWSDPLDIYKSAICLLIYKTGQDGKRHITADVHISELLENVAWLLLPTGNNLHPTLFSISPSKKKWWLAWQKQSSHLTISTTVDDCLGLIHWYRHG